MCRALADHAFNRSEYAAHGGDFAAVFVTGGGEGIEMAEEFVGAVYKMNFHTWACFPGRLPHAAHAPLKLAGRQFATQLFPAGAIALLFIAFLLSLRSLLRFR